MIAAFVGGLLFLGLVAWVVRLSYCHLAPHGSVVRVLYEDCSQCTATSWGGHVLCNCGATSEHIGYHVIRSVRGWRLRHRGQVRERK